MDPRRQVRHGTFVFAYDAQPVAWRPAVVLAGHVDVGVLRVFNNVRQGRRPPAALRSLPSVAYAYSTVCGELLPYPQDRGRDPDSAIVPPPNQRSIVIPSRVDLHSGAVHS